MHRSSLRQSDFSKGTMLSFAAVFALVGCYLLFRSFADTTPPDADYNTSDWFASNSFWNQPVPANATLDPNSAAMTAYLDQQIGVNPDGTLVSGTNGDRWFTKAPVYVVPADQPLKTVCSRAVLNNNSWGWMDDLNAAWMDDKVPVPDGIVNNGGGNDRSVSIYQPSTNTLWDFYQGPEAPNSNQTVDPQGRPCDYVASGGGRILNVGTMGGTVPDSVASPGYYRDDPPTEDRLWGGRASGLPTAAGAIQPQEWNDPLNINHTLSMIVPWAQHNVHYWPASKQDTNSDDGFPAIPEGARVRIDPSYQCPGRGTITDQLTPLYYDRVTGLCHTLQKYGAIVVDQSSTDMAVLFRSGGATTWDPDTIESIHGGQHWESDYWNSLRVALTHLQVIDPSSYMAPSTVLHEGDVNDDGTTDIQDLSMLLSSYGKDKNNKCAGNSTYTCDLNGDNNINIIDLSLMLNHYGN